LPILVVGRVVDRCRLYFGSFCKKKKNELNQKSVRL
jgi:hypothetical protein